jgi:hypothetical protein
MVETLAAKMVSLMAVKKVVHLVWLMVGKMVL